MTLLIGVLALIVIIVLLVVQLGGSIGALFFGRKLPWLWFTLAVLELVAKILAVALYRETDALRAGVSLTGGFLAAGVALLLRRRFPAAVLVLGGLLAAGLSAIQVLGPLLNPLPQWLVMALLAGAGVAGAIWTRTNQDSATIVLSALIGAGILADQVVDTLGIDEALRFQVYAVIALAGIGFQLWRERRAQRAGAPNAQGALS
jgi:hypothetical protein